MSQNKIEDSVSFLLTREKLKKDKDFKVITKIGGGKKVVVVEFKKQQHVDDHSDGLKKYAEREQIELQIKVA